MTRTRVVILSGHSLFAEGVASRLRQHLEQLELLTVDSGQSDALDRVLVAQPAAVILDASDAGEATPHCSVDKLLRSLPSLKIIRLDPQYSTVQVVTSEQRPAGEVSDLIKVIQPSG